ncbi:hypothetical protein E4U42_005616 [Claviceps africana]|uniref:Uncharacterized protein n=1 Tax=Claviceps africana TaxID=83212 RepID=A0A8K0J3H9_9HYPO|nr:hypothetical protein E4U42_005616 [Claviceps africana]
MPASGSDTIDVERQTGEAGQRRRAGKRFKPIGGDRSGPVQSKSKYKYKTSKQGQSSARLCHERHPAGRLIFPEWHYAPRARCLKDRDLAWHRSGQRPVDKGQDEIIDGRVMGVPAAKPRLFAGRGAPVAGNVTGSVTARARVKVDGTHHASR